MQPGERLTLRAAIAGALGAGEPLAADDAAAIFVEALRLAAGRKALLSAGRVLIDEDGGIALADVHGAPAVEQERVREACALAAELFGAARTKPPLLLDQWAPAAGRYPTLRHLLDAVELQLLVSSAERGKQPPDATAARIAAARLVYASRRPRKVPEAEAITDPPEPVTGSPAGPGKDWQPLRSLPALVAASLAVAALIGVAFRSKGAGRAAAGSSIALSAPSPSVPLPPLSIQVTRDPEPAAPPPRSAVAPRTVRRRSESSSASDARARSRAQLDSGERALQAGHVFQALVALRAALDEQPPVPEAARRLGDVYRTTGQHALAVAAYERYLELAPSAPDVDEVRAALRELRPDAADQ